MDFDELMELLEIESPSEFVYFEQFAELIESDADIPLETFTELFSEIESGILSELTESYFEDLLKFVPDDETELYTLLETIGTTMSSLAAGVDQEDAEHVYAEEFFKFRNWYLYDGRVLCEDRTANTEVEYSVMEALTNYRLQSLGDGDYSYDFSEALDYPLDEYIVSLATLTTDSYGDGDEDEDDYLDDEEEDYDY